MSMICERLADLRTSPAAGSERGSVSSGSSPFDAVVRDNRPWPLLTVPLTPANSPP